MLYDIHPLPCCSQNLSPILSRLTEEHLGVLDVTLFFFSKSVYCDEEIFTSYLCGL